VFKQIKIPTLNQPTYQKTMEMTLKIQLFLFPLYVIMLIKFTDDSTEFGANVILAPVMKPLDSENNAKLRSAIKSIYIYGLSLGVTSKKKTIKKLNLNKTRIDRLFLVFLNLLVIDFPNVSNTLNNRTLIYIYIK
jgi:hypothetical protein